MRCRHDLAALKVARYEYKSVRTSRRRKLRVLEKRQDSGWEFVSQSNGRFRTTMELRRLRSDRRWRRGPLISTLAATIVLGVLIAVAWQPVQKSPAVQARDDAATAIRALDKGDLAALATTLSAHRGQTDFAYFFASQATPRELGDTLASAASDEAEGSLKANLTTHAYELGLTDVAGTLALATHGTGARTLPSSWTDDFVAATTTPEELYPEGDQPTAAEMGRADQDSANKQNLLLLLSRGYWSSDFLRAVTTAYWTFDHDLGEDAWPSKRIDGARYAPAPNGAYLTDGLLALAAALTANPDASAWAFADFQRGTQRIDGSDLEIGAFAHYLLFEHRYPESSDREGIGMTAVLTAMSSAIAVADATRDGQSGETGAQADQAGPMHDLVVLRALANGIADTNGCSINPVDYLDCATVVAESVWHWIHRWGHVILEVLTLAAFVPNPYVMSVGVGAAAINSAWFAIDGDYVSAGLSLAVVLPALGVSKIAVGAKAGTAARKSAAEADEVARVAKANRARPNPAEVRARAAAGAERIEKSPRAGYAREAEAQSDLQKQMPGSEREKTLDPGCRKSCEGKRRVDVYDQKSRLCIEVKRGLGTTNFRHELREIEKDRLLLRRRTCSRVEWHFFPDADGKVGPHEELRTLLQNNRIPYVPYFP